MAEQNKKKMVKKASKMADPIGSLGCLPSEKSLSTSGERLRVETKWATHLSDEIMQWVIDLFYRNMRELYERSQWGMDLDDKRRELSATTARYVLLFNSDDRPIAYVHYRLDMDHDFAVLYCYEIQVEEEYQQKGIGSLLMAVLERAANKLGMDKLMATVFTFNEQSLRFFSKSGYEEDESTPKGDAATDYVILSKKCQAVQAS